MAAPLGGVVPAPRTIPASLSNVVRPQTSVSSAYSVLTPLVSSGLMAIPGESPITPEVLELIPAIVVARPRAAISLWHPRDDITKRASSRLKCCNHSFLALCDAVAFKNSDCQSVLVITPQFINEETARTVRTATERGLRLIDSVHRGELDRGEEVVVHVSRVGRLNMVRLELYAFRVEKRLIEYLIIETRLDQEVWQPGNRVEEILLKDYTRLEPTQSAPPGALREIRHGPCTFVLVSGYEASGAAKFVQWDAEVIHLKARKRSAPILDTKPFSCDFCGIKQTSVRRRGPHGPHTLCNACGIKWTTGRRDSQPATI